MRILETFAQPLGTDQEQEESIDLHHQLNHAGGIAADAVMRVAWQQIYLSRDDEERRLPNELEDRLDNAVEHGWGGLEFRHALGEFGFIVQWGDPTWLSRNASRLWPIGDDPASLSTRRAFLTGYLQQRQWSKSALAALFSLYFDVIQDLPLDRRLYLAAKPLVEAFVHHLVLGWLNDVEGFDVLLDEFVAKAPDDIRTQFVRILGRQYIVTAEQDGLDNDATLRKREDYWTRRVAELRSLPIAVPSEELSAFCSWAARYPGHLRHIEPRLEASINHLSASQRAVWHLLKGLAERGEAEPLSAARLLEKLVDRLVGGDQSYWGWHNGQIEEAIDAICRGALPSHRTHLRRIVNRLLQSGTADFSEKLARCGAKRSG